MDHHYSLTNRMLAILLGGLVVLAVLLFAFGLLVGREIGTQDALALIKTPPPKPAIPIIARSPALPIQETPASAAPLPVEPEPALKTNQMAAPEKAEAAVPPAPPTRRQSGTNSITSAEMPRLFGDEQRQTNTVEVRVPIPPPESKPRSPKSGNRYVVYAGAFENPGKAENLMEEIKNRGLSSEVREVAKPGSGSLFAVRIGPFDTRALASAALPAIRDAGADGVTIHAIP